VKLKEDNTGVSSEGLPIRGGRVNSWSEAIQ
jgi:hypothetical protein